MGLSPWWEHLIWGEGPFCPAFPRGMNASEMCLGNSTMLMARCIQAPGKCSCSMCPWHIATLLSRLTFSGLRLEQGTGPLGYFVCVCSLVPQQRGASSFTSYCGIFVSTGLRVALRFGSHPSWWWWLLLCHSSFLCSFLLGIS